MDPAPGNVYSNDLSLMDPTDSSLLLLSLLGSTSTHASWSINTVFPDVMPGHLVPGVPFPDYPR